MNASETLTGLGSDPRRWAAKANLIAAASCRRRPTLESRTDAARELGHLRLVVAFRASMVPQEARR